MQHDYQVKEMQLARVNHEMNAIKEETTMKDAQIR